ncbi:MAG: hypothetical protein ACOCYU_07490 [Brevefilum sp.]
MRSKENRLIKIGLKEKSILLFLLVSLPFGLYAAMQIGASLLAWFIAGLLMLFMCALVWLA